jgi:hypothetical protein
MARARPAEIEACKSVIFVVSPASVASEACGHELADAVSLNKLIIPVVHQDVPVNQMPTALADSEWVFLRDGDDPDASTPCSRWPRARA